MKRLLLFLAILAISTPAAALTTLTKQPVAIRASAAHTTDLTISFVNPEMFCGMYIIFSVTAEVATAVIAPTLQWIETAAGTTGANFSKAMSTFAATGTFIYEVRSGVATGAAPIDVILDRPLPYRFNLFLDHADADAMTYSASVHAIRYCG